MERSGNNAGMFIINRPKPVTTIEEARRVFALETLKKAKQARSHFKVVPTEQRTWNDVVFASLHEMRNHQSLTQQEELGLISNLRRQVKYELVICGMKISSYRADHVYYDNTLKREVVADSKGKRTEAFIIKKRLMKLIYNIDVMEI